jgi:hypothetical protein
VVPLLLLTWGEFVVDVVGLARTPAPGSGLRWPASASWVAARLAWEGHPELLYDIPAFGRESERLGAHRDIFTANLPTTALVYLPLAPWSIRTAYRTWILFSLGCFGLAGLILVAALRLGRWWGLALAALAPLYEPWRLNMVWGQVYSVMLLLAVLGGLGMVWGAPEGRVAPRRARLLAGLALGLGCCIKLYYGGVLLLPALVRRSGGVVAVASGVFGLVALATLVWWGPGLWATAIPLSLGWRARPESASTAYQSLNSWLMHFLHYDPTWNPAVPANLPDAVLPLWTVLALFLLVISGGALWRGGSPDRRALEQRLLLPALAVPLALLLAPVSEGYHYVLALFPLLVVGATLARRTAPPGVWLGFGAVVLLLGAPWLYNTGPVAGWTALLHYPRLYGALLLWGFVVALLWRPLPQPPQLEAQTATP